MNELNKIPELAEKHANDTNWLAVCLLFLCVLALAWLFRWVITRFDAIATKCTETIATNSVVINECRDTICEATDFMKRKSHIIILGLGLVFASGCTGGAAMIRAAGKDSSAATLQIKTIYGTVIYSRAGASTNSIEITDTGNLKQNK